MFKIHTRDGRTTRLDLRDEDQAREFLHGMKRNEFQDSMSGVTVLRKCGGRFRCPSCHRGKRLVCANCGRDESRADCGKTTQFSLSRPDGFNSVFYHVEEIEADHNGKIRGGEKVTCFVDDFRVTMMIHRDQPSVRLSLLKTGKQQYNPLAE